MAFFKRISLFLLTNLLVMATVSIVFTFITSYFQLSQASGYIAYVSIFSLVWGMGGAFISLLISKWMAKRMMGVQIINAQTQDPEARALMNSVHNLARKAGLTEMPEVGIYDSPEINAFATGPSRRNSLVAVSTGLLQRMNRDEVEGVLAHEVTHVANGDMVTMTLITGVVNSFALFFSRILANVLASQVEDKSRHTVQWIATIILDIVFTILGSIVVNYYSRIREYRADYGGAKYAGREKMIAGLRKLQAQFGQIEGENNAFATMKISNKSTGILSLFSSHPSLEDRIERLQKVAIM